jgi:MFS family permease
MTDSFKSDQDIEKNVVHSASNDDSGSTNISADNASQLARDEESRLRWTDDYSSRGVRRMEKLKRVMDETKKGKYIRILFCTCIIITSFVLALDGSTTASYEPYATSSFGHHSMLSTLSIATSVISSVSKPIVAKIADVTSRPATYILVLSLYTMGYIICASSSSISAYIVGNVFVTVGSSNIDLINSISLADIIPLKYRGFMFGLTAAPYIITVWIAGGIVNHFIIVSWRWGYGMFAILMPAVLGPCIAILIYLEHYAQSVFPEEKPAVAKPKRTLKTFSKHFWRYAIEGDLFGMIIMAFGWALLLLPFSLYSSAQGGYDNPSLIAMFVVGSLLLVIYTIYEVWFAPFPSMPKRILKNRTFIVAVIVDFFYMAGEGILLLYLSSYVGVVKDWSYTNWTYFNNALTLSICFFGVIVGVIQRYTHRTKFIQIIGLAIQVIAMIVALWARYENSNTSALVWVQILLGMGGAASNIGSQVASQASVPHQDVALVIALLLQWSTIGYAISAAIGGAIWENKLPGALARYLPSSVSAEDAELFYGDYSAIQEYDLYSDVRQGAILAYNHVIYYLFAIALGFTVISFVAAFFQKNYYLGDSQNGVDADDQDRPPRNRFERILYWIDNPFTYKKKYGSGSTTTNEKIDETVAESS